MSSHPDKVQTLSFRREIYWLVNENSVYTAVPVIDVAGRVSATRGGLELNGRTERLPAGVEKEV
jgi:hypothetical protein